MPGLFYAKLYPWRIPQIQRFNSKTHCLWKKDNTAGFLWFLGRGLDSSCIFLERALYSKKINQSFIHVTYCCCCCCSSPSWHLSALLTIFQVWFQNRRAKFRRNERAMLANKNASLLKSYSGDVTAVEQPIVPRPAPRPTDYLSWGTASPYRWMTGPLSLAPLPHAPQPSTTLKAAFAAGWHSLLGLPLQRHSTCWHPHTFFFPGDF